MGIHLADQTITFIRALLTGAALGLLYDAFRISRIAIPTSSKVLFVEDILYCIICGVITFWVMMSTVDGKVRMFLVIGEGIGAILYFCSLSIFVMKVSKTIIACVRAIFRFVFKWLLLPIWRVFYWIVSTILRPGYFFLSLLKKIGQRLNFRLKVNRLLLYNHCKDYLRHKNENKIPTGETNDKDAKNQNAKE